MRETHMGNVDMEKVSYGDFRQSFEAEVKQALENIDVSTARGRRVLDKREVNIEPHKSDVSICASDRARGYLTVAMELRGIVERNHIGITDGELESVEFIMEQLEALARRSHEQVIRTY